MRTTIIPAQITTVEDKIAGSLNMTQILLLMAPIVWTALVYTLFFPTMKLVPYKLVLIVSVTALCLVLALRIKDKIVAAWLGILLSYRMRPKYWLFNKNDLTNRTLDIPELPAEHVTIKKHATSIHAKASNIALSDLMKLEYLIGSGKVAIRYHFEHKAI